MSETIQSLIDKIESSEQCESFLMENPDAYLAHLFKMDDKDNKDIWQIGYYEPNTDSIHVFEYNEKTDDIVLNPGAEAFKDEKKDITKLNLDKIKISPGQAKEIAFETIKKEYPKDLPKSSIMIIQNIEDLGDIYNFTFITITFKTVNVKIDADTGDILFHKLFSIFDFKQN